MCSKQIVGKIVEFNEELESFQNYSERLEHFFNVNAIKDENKISFFISIMGPALYTRLKDLIHPLEIGDEKVTFKYIIRTLKDHYVPKVNTTYERFIFNKGSQKEGESIAEYSVRLKKLASTCNFGDFLDEALRDRFLCGLRSTQIQSKLLAEGTTLDFPKALEMSLVIENADKNVRSIHPESQIGLCGEVNYLVKRKNNFKHNLVGPNKPKMWRDAQKQKCFRCGKLHDYKTCPYIESVCYSCNKKGHLSNMCRLKETGNKFRPKFKPNNRVNVCQSDNPEDEGSTDQDQCRPNELYTIAYAGNNSTINSFVTEMMLNNIPTEMVIDTGAVVTVMPDSVYNEKFKKTVPVLRTSNVKLKTYTGEKINVLGEFQVNVTTRNGEFQLPVVVVKGSSSQQPTLMGRNWIERIKLDWSCVKTVCSKDLAVHQMRNGESVPFTHIMSDLKQKYSEVFEESIGEIKNLSVDIVLKENVRPVFCKARNVPYALRSAVEKELNNLQENGVIYPVSQSDWATPLVVVPKADNKVRLCGDFKVTLNPNIRTDHYPLPNPEDIFSSISGAKLFTKLDLSAAYNQLRVNESSQELLTITTHKGLFRFARLPFGISSAGALFQSTMDKILHGLENTRAYMDDILIFSKDIKEMTRRVDAVLKRLHEYGVKINSNKSEFFKERISFLGHCLDQNGIHQSKELTKAIVSAPVPLNISQLRSYLGLLNYYGKFLPNLSSLLHPLYNLLQHDVKWNWSDSCQIAFEKSKALLLKDNVLMPYDPKLDIVVTCDSSSYGVGSVIAHILPDGTERPIAFASRTLTKCESKYSQIEKEALALLFSVKKFHNFLYGRRFTLVTDHRPLIFLLGPTKAVPTLAAARIQRWALALSAYDYNIRYKKGSEISNADALSRLPCSSSEPTEEDGEVIFFTITYQLPITYKEIGLATKYDPTMSKVQEYTSNGWPSQVHDQTLKPYLDKTLQLSCEKDCILWGSRVIIPPTHRKEVLLMLHAEHPGESKMKALARSYAWWPNMDQEIENMVKGCKICQRTRKSATLAPLQPWSWPKHNWQRIHIDFAHYEGKDFLLIVDSHSKWIEVFYMPTTTSIKTIEKLRHCFAAYGLPCTVVSDGGPQFTSHEFKEFLKSNGVHHTFSPPFHPPSNGLAERAVQTVKEAFLKQMLHDSTYKVNRSLQHRIDSFLFSYRNTPHSTTGIAPSEEFLKFKPRTHLSLLKPYLANEINSKQEKMVNAANIHRGKPRFFNIGDHVFVRTVRNEDVNWNSGEVIKVVSPVTYLVRVDGRTRFVHADHLRVDMTKHDEEEDILHQFPREIFQPSPRLRKVVGTPPSPNPATPLKAMNKSPEEKVVGVNINNESEDLRRSQRVRRVPQRLNL